MQYAVPPMHEVATGLIGSPTTNAPVVAETSVVAGGRRLGVKWRVHTRLHCGILFPCRLVIHESPRMRSQHGTGLDAFKVVE